MADTLDFVLGPAWNCCNTTASESFKTLSLGDEIIFYTPGIGPPPSQYRWATETTSVYSSGAPIGYHPVLRHEIEAVNAMYAYKKFLKRKKLLLT